MNLKLDMDNPADREIAPSNSRSCRWEKNAKGKKASLKFSRSLCADNLSKAGWSWGCVSAIDSKGRTMWIADAHRGDGIVNGVYRSRNIDYSPLSDHARAAV